jgi:hypothetical protein
LENSIDYLGFAQSWNALEIGPFLHIIVPSALVSDRLPLSPALFPESR